MRPDLYFRDLLQSFDRDAEHGLTEDARIRWTIILQREDPNGCHTDDKSMSDTGSVHDAISIREVLRAWREDEG